MNTVTFVLAMAAMIGSGLIGGVFFGFSSFVMRSLARLPAPQGISAMQSINIVVINPSFMLPFLGTAAVSLALAVVAALNWSNPESTWLLAGGLIYPIGVILVTFAFNVPRNNEVAALDPGDPSAADSWFELVRSWTAWNTVRTVAGAAASTLFAIGMIVA